jgi:hypothetical protein
MTFVTYPNISLKVLTNAFAPRAITLLLVRLAAILTMDQYQTQSINLRFERTELFKGVIEFLETMFYNCSNVF